MSCPTCHRPTPDSSTGHRSLCLPCTRAELAAAATKRGKK